MNILLNPAGSSGDILPFIRLGMALKARGHDVTVITMGRYEPLARHANLAFVEWISPEALKAAEDNPDLWHPTRGLVLAIRTLEPWYRQLHELIQARHVPGQTVLVAGSLNLGARLAHDWLGVPLATLLLQPAFRRSVHRSPVLPGLPMPGWAPRLWKRLVYFLGDRMLDRVAGPGVNALRAEQGLPPVRGVLGNWWLAPQRVIGLFPAWYGPPQPDWPAQVRLTGFPLYDGLGAEPVPAGLDEFLGEGEPPLVFTPGTMMRHPRRFFAEAVDACRRLRRRGLLLTRYRDQLPAILPPDVRHFDYVPLSRVLPRAATLVSHGGIGTLSQALAAGIPQLVMPLGFDQFDNAARLERLGVAATLLPRAFRGPAVARQVGRLLGSAAVASGPRHRPRRHRWPGRRVSSKGWTPSTRRATSTTSSRENASSSAATATPRRSLCKARRVRASRTRRLSPSSPGCKGR
jgi:UDP:flavonoid glycosyltransferase YjiC (YdhE family)